MKKYKNIGRNSLILCLMLNFPLSFTLRAQDSNQNENEAKKDKQASTEALESQSIPAPASPEPALETPKQARPSEESKNPQAPLTEEKIPLQTKTESSKNTQKPAPRTVQTSKVNKSPAKTGSKPVVQEDAKWNKRHYYTGHRGGFFRFLPLFAKGKMSFKIPESSPRARGSGLRAQRNSVLLNDIAQGRKDAQGLNYAGNVFGFEMLLGASPIDNIAFHGGLFYLSSSTASKQKSSQKTAVADLQQYDYQYSFGGLALGVTSYSMPANLYFSFQGRVVTKGGFNIITPNPEYRSELLEGPGNYQYMLQEKYVIESGNGLGYSVTFGWEGRFTGRGLRFLNMGVAFQYAKDVFSLANYAAAEDLEAQHSYYGLALSLTFF